MNEDLNIKWRRYRIMARMIARQIKPNDDWVRGSGSVICPHCGLEMYDHPTCSDTLLVVGCDGKLWKL